MAPVQSGNRVAYRKTGTIEKDQPKTAAKAISDGYAINGEIGWLWDDMPDGVRDALSRLCEDVPCLGEMDSPVVMSIETVEANWRLDSAATAFTPGGLRVQIPHRGEPACSASCILSPGRLRSQLHPQTGSVPRETAVTGIPHLRGVLANRQVCGGGTVETSRWRSFSLE